MGLFREMKEARFWKGWQDRFERERDDFITPSHPAVVQAANKASTGATATEDVALDAWQYIYDNVSYKLSKEWKEPAQTLREGTGDCEDVTFLAASMLPNMGVDRPKIAIGELTFPSGADELHTWVIAGDTIIDPTGRPRTDLDVSYRPVHKYTINLK